MKTDFSVYASLLSATPAGAENIAAWLADREAARDAMTMSVDMTVQDAERLAAESGAYDEEIAVSQIRILSKRYTAEPDVIPYVAVVDKWDDDMWLIVPFSPYKTPATQGEMKTGLDAYGLHVLQAWNGRTVQDQILKKSYLFGTLPEEVRADALSLFRHELGGVPLPENFTAERGSRIVEAADPRREYLDECIQRLTPLAEAVLDLAEHASERHGGVLNVLFDKYLPEVSGYALAAATDDLEPRVPVLLHKGAWDAMIDGREASGFSGYSSRGGGQSGLTFYLCGDIPHEFDGVDELSVAAYKRDTRELVGKGVMKRLDGGRCKISVRLGDGCEFVDVQDARELVLVAE